MADHELDYQAIRKQVVRRLRKRILFYVHLIIYLAISLAPRLGGMGAFLVLWFPVILFHFTFAFDIWSRWVDIWSRWVDRATRRELERLRRQGYAIANENEEKPKRGQVARLADDGELVYDDVLAHEAEPGRRRKRARP